MLNSSSFIEDFLVIPDEGGISSALAEIDNSWSKYGCPTEVFCITHWKIFFEKEKHMENAIKWLEQNNISYKRCKVKI